MKKTCLSFALCISLCLNTIAQEAVNPKEEPKQTFELTVNGKKYEVAEGDEFKLDSLVKPTITIKTSPFKTFDNTSISFRYPKHLSYEYEETFGFRNWSFSGNNLVVMVFELDAKTLLNNLVEETVKRFGKKNCVVKDFQKKLGTKTWDGKQILVTLAGEKMMVEYYEVVLNDFKSRFIYFQDLIKDDSSSLEYDKGFEIINSTITFKDAGATIKGQ